MAVIIGQGSRLLPFPRRFVQVQAGLCHQGSTRSSGVRGVTKTVNNQTLSGRYSCAFPGSIGGDCVMRREQCQPPESPGTARSPLYAKAPLEINQFKIQGRRRGHLSFPWGHPMCARIYLPRSFFPSRLRCASRCRYCQPTPLSRYPNGPMTSAITCPLYNLSKPSLLPLVEARILHTVWIV